MGQKAAAGGGVVGGGRAGGRRRGILLNFRTVRSRHILSVGALICIFFSRRPGAFAPRRGPKAPITAGIRSPVHLSDLCRLFDWVWNTPFEALVRVKARKQHRSAFSVFFFSTGGLLLPSLPAFLQKCREFAPGSGSSFRVVFSGAHTAYSTVFEFAAPPPSRVLRDESQSRMIVHHMAKSALFLQDLACPSLVVLAAVTLNVYWPSLGYVCYPLSPLKTSLMSYFCFLIASKRDSLSFAGLAFRLPCSPRQPRTGTRWRNPPNRTLLFSSVLFCAPASVVTSLFVSRGAGECGPGILELI